MHTIKRHGRSYALSFNGYLLLDGLPLAALQNYCTYLRVPYTVE
jgi:hypothetical protein